MNGYCQPSKIIVFISGHMGDYLFMFSRKGTIFGRQTLTIIIVKCTSNSVYKFQIASN